MKFTLVLEVYGVINQWTCYLEELLSKYFSAIKTIMNILNQFQI